MHVNVCCALSELKKTGRYQKGGRCLPRPAAACDPTAAGAAPLNRRSNIWTDPRTRLRTTACYPVALPVLGANLCCLLRLPVKIVFIVFIVFIILSKKPGRIRFPTVTTGGRYVHSNMAGTTEGGVQTWCHSIITHFLTMMMIFLVVIMSSATAGFAALTPITNANIYEL